MGHNGRLLHSSTGLSPPRGSHAALPIACDAFNARTVAIREYRPPVCRRPQAATLAFRAVLVAPLFRREKPLGASAVWLGTDGKVSVLPYDAPPFSCGHFCQGTPSGHRVSGSMERKNKDISASGAVPLL